jgi:hypothetical protein
MPDIVPVPLPPDAAPVNWELNDQLFGMFEASDILNNLWPQAESIWPLQ